MLSKSWVMVMVGVLVTLGSSAWAEVNMAWVPVGDPGNAPDDTGWGRVDYVYRIGKYEVTNAQYITFLSAVAVSDTYGLYNTEFETEVDGGIVRTGSDGSYTYGPRDGDPNWLNRPVTRVTFWDACRLANWLHNGQPGQGGPPVPQDANSTEDGAYTLNGYTGPDGRFYQSGFYGTKPVPFIYVKQ